MALVDDLRVLQSRAVSELHAAHDFFTDSNLAWKIVRKVVAAGTRFAVRSPTTSSVTTQVNLVAKATGYVTQLAEATFLQFVSIFESFFFDLLRLWLTAYPENLIGKKIDIKAVLDAPDKDAILQFAVNKELNEILYERPASWFAYLEDKAKLGCPTAEEIERIAEAKAARDVLAHSRGIANKAYLAKAGRFARCQDGERIDISETYHRQTWELLRKVVTDLSTAGLAKASR